MKALLATIVPKKILKLLKKPNKTFRDYLLLSLLVLFGFLFFKAIVATRLIEYHLKDSD